MRISDWSSDVCSSDLAERTEYPLFRELPQRFSARRAHHFGQQDIAGVGVGESRARIEQQAALALHHRDQTRLGQVIAALAFREPEEKIDRKSKRLNSSH